MPTNKQRIVAVGTTAALVFGGAWMASMAKHTPVNAGEASQGIAETKPITMQETTLGSKAEIPAPSKSASGAHLTVSIDGIRNTKGKIYVMVFDNAAAFASYDYQRTVGFAELPASVQRVATEFPDLSGKAYAISVFHDENGNQQFDMSGGYPTEGYGTSRAKSAYDDLEFHQARVKPGPIRVKIFYLK